MDSSTDFYIFDGSSSSSSSVFRNSSPDMFSSDTTTTTDLFCNNELYSVEESLNIFDHFTPQHILSSSPPSDLLGTLSLSQHIPTGLYPNFSDFQISDAVKTEKFFDGHNQAATMARSYSTIENSGRYMQRSFSSNSVEGKQTQVPFNIPMMDSSNLSYNNLSSPENAFFSSQMRRVYSTGDLQVSVLCFALFFLLCNFLLKVLSFNLVFRIIWKCRDRLKTQRCRFQRNRTSRWDVTVQKNVKRKYQSTELNETRETLPKLLR